MGDQPPSDKLFEQAPGNANRAHQRDSIAFDDELAKIARLKAMIPKLLQANTDRGRARQFLPYLLVRSVVGDRGDRPLNVPFWESPDIWTAEGDPATTPAIPPTPGGTVTAGKPATVYAHVWNLGRAPLTGIRIEFYWFNPALGFSDKTANLIGLASTTLAPRSSPKCHRLVKCPKAWVPTHIQSGHECIIVRVSGLGDPLGTTYPWSSAYNRHVAQRNIHVTPPNTNLADLIQILSRSILPDLRVQLIQVGEQAKTTVQLMAPGLVIDPRVQTQVLGELRPDGSLQLPFTEFQATGALAPFHSLSPLRQPDITRLGPLDAPRVQVHNLLGLDAAPPQRLVRAPVSPNPTPGAAIPVLNARGDVPALFLIHQLVPPEVAGSLKFIDPPPPGQAQVLRLAAYQGDQLVGGYTIIVGTPASQGQGT